MKSETVDTSRLAGDSSEKVSIGSAALLGLVGSAGTAALSIVRSKITALVLGPAGVGMTSEILQITALFNAPAAMFTGPAFVAAVAKARSESDQAKVSRLYFGAFSGALVLSAAGGIAAVVAGRFLLPAPWGREAWPLAILSVVGALFGAAAAVPAQLMVGHALLRVLTVSTLLSAAVQTAVVTAGTVWLGLTGQFVGLALGPAASLGIALVLGARANPHVRWRPAWTFDRAFAGDAAKVGGTALVASIGLQLALVIVRVTLDRAGGTELNGHFQAAWTIGTVYFGLILAGLANYSFPRYAAARDADELRSEVATAGKFVLRAAPPLVLLVVAFREPVVRRLYSASFDPAVQLTALMMVGDVAKAIVWVQHGALLARGNLRAYLVVEVCGIALLAAGSAFLIPRVGLDGVGYAYTAAYLLLLPLSTIALRVASGVSLGWRSLVMTVVATALLATAARYGERSGGGRWVVAAAALAWAAFAGLIGDAYRKLRPARADGDGALPGRP